jgi:hypothetical protein
MVCVAHSGFKAGVSCAPFDATTGIGAFDQLRPFDLKQSNPPTGPENGVGITFFNEDSTQLVTMVKGNPAQADTFPGFISMFPIEGGVVAAQDTKTTPEGTGVLFGAAVIPGTTNILATDASFGAAVMDMNNLAKPLAKTELANQKATCWATVSKSTGTGFVTDVGVNHLVEVDVATGEQLLDLQSQNGNIGMIDLQASGNMIYALAASDGSMPPAVTVFDVSGGKGAAREVQNFVVDGADNRAMGMAFHT